MTGVYKLYNFDDLVEAVKAMEDGETRVFPIVEDMRVYNPFEYMTYLTFRTGRGLIINKINDIEWEIYTFM